MQRATSSGEDNSIFPGAKKLTFSHFTGKNRNKAINNSRNLTLLSLPENGFKLEINTQLFNCTVQLGRYSLLIYYFSFRFNWHSWKWDWYPDHREKGLEANFSWRPSTGPRVKANWSWRPSHRELFQSVHNYDVGAFSWLVHWNWQSWHV